MDKSIKAELEKITESSLEDLGIEELDSRMEMAAVPLFFFADGVNQTQCNCQHNYVAGCGT